MSELKAQLGEWRQQLEDALGPDTYRLLLTWLPRILAGILIVIGIVLPFFFTQDSGFMNATIIAVVAVNGQDVHLFGMTLTAGNLGISAVDSPYLFGLQFTQLNLRYWYWLILGVLLVVLFITVQLRRSRLGRAWIALREDEVAAVSMGIPAVRTKLLAYAIGAAMGGMAGAFFGTYYTTVNAGQFAFGFSIFILSMVIIGGLGSIWGAVAGGLLLGYINNYLIPDVLNDLPSKFGLHFQLTEVEFGIFGFLLVIVMVLRPQGLLPERRRRLELTGDVAARDAELGEPPS